MCGALCPGNAGSSPSCRDCHVAKGPSDRTGPERRENKPITADPRDFSLSFLDSPPSPLTAHIWVGWFVFLRSSCVSFSLFSSESSLQLKKAGRQMPAFQPTGMKKQTIICASVGGVLLCYATISSDACAYLHATCGPGLFSSPHLHLDCLHLHRPANPA
jgi:hypothetical protein